MAGAETNTDNNDGKGNKDGGGGGVIGALLTAAAAAAAAALISFGNKVFGPRSVVVTVTNATPFTLKKIAENNDAGGFDTFPKSEIPPNASDSFVEKSTSPIGDCNGSVTYEADGISLLVGWNNPRVGSNHTNHTLSGPNKSRFLVGRETGSGDEKAQMLFGITIHPDYFVRPSLAKRGQPDLSKGIGVAASALGKSARPISLRDLVDF